MMLPVLIVATFTSALAYTRPCPRPTGAYAVCQLNTVYIIDTTTYVNSSDIIENFDWMRHNILPGTAWDTDEKVGFMSYGTGASSTNPLSNSEESACNSLDKLQDSYLQQGSSQASLKTALQIFGITYPEATSAVLFSASQDQNDIDQASSYARSSLQWIHFTVVAMNGADFSGFPAFFLYNISTLANSPENLGPCLIQRTCNLTGECDVNSGTIPTVLTAPPTTAMTTESPPTTSSNPEAENGPQCRCNFQTVWNDVMFLFDSSQGTTQSALDQMWNSTLEMLNSFNVQNLSYKDSDYFMRVGVISYASQAQIIASLGQFDHDQLLNISIPYYSNDTKTNLESALTMAISEFNSTSHRESSAKVILVMSSMFNQTEANPVPVADSFKDNGGVLMVYDYIQDHGYIDDVLEQIASNGYFFSNSNNSVEDLKKAQCDANCFCQADQTIFTTDPVRNFPTGGCYTISILQANYMLAKSRCEGQGGVLASDKTSIKNAFLCGLFRAPTNFYLGLIFNSSSRQWVWIDGTPLGSYSPWYLGSVPEGTNDQQCSYVIAYDNAWVATNCKNSYDYICEFSPCDSMNYCSKP